MILLSFFKPFPPQKPLPVRLSSWASHYLPLLFITSAAWPPNHLHGFGCPSHLASSYRKGPPSLSRQPPPPPPPHKNTKRGLRIYFALSFSDAISMTLSPLLFLLFYFSSLFVFLVFSFKLYWNQT